jgi:hypothetical protein
MKVGPHISCTMHLCILLALSLSFCIKDESPRYYILPITVIWCRLTVLFPKSEICEEMHEIQRYFSIQQTDARTVGILFFVSIM